MSSREVECVCNYLKTKDITLSHNNIWLSKCINWYKNHPDLRNIYGSLEEFVCIQWLLSDLQDVQNSCLPTIHDEKLVKLNGKYCVQINWLRDISKSCYSQLQEVEHPDGTVSFITEDEPKKPSWEPKGKRVLLMEFTDGVTTLKGMEYSLIPKLNEPFLPGSKVVLLGLIECRNGIMLLKNENITILGGEVESFYQKYSLQNILSRCLNIVNERENQNVEMNINAPNRLPNNVLMPERPPPEFQELPQTTYPDQDTSLLNRSNFLMDDDDEFLGELPDEILNCAEETVRHSSPVLDERDTNRHSNNPARTFQDQQVRDNSPIFHQPVVSNNAPGPKRPKLFPSLEDINPVRNEAPSTSRVSELERSILATQKTKTETKSNFNIKDDEYVISASNCIQYPYINQVIIKVDIIDKLKIRNSEWFCCASVTTSDQQLKVTFSNNVLEKLFGIPASEVEVWRGEMSSNPSIKKKVNDILKAGQTKLKILNCSMTLEYSSENCMPNVIAIDLLN